MLHSSPSPPRGIRRVLGLAALLAAVTTWPGAAQITPEGPDAPESVPTASARDASVRTAPPEPVSPAEPVPAAATPADAGEYPQPFWLALLAMVLCGAAGAFAADIVGDGGRVERMTSDDRGWMFGFLGKLIVGSVAAVVVLSLNGPGESWWALMGTALAAGLGGEAILLARISASNALEADKDRAATENKRQIAAELHAEQIKGMTNVAAALGGCGTEPDRNAAGVGANVRRALAPDRDAVLRAYADAALAQSAAVSSG